MTINSISQKPSFQVRLEFIVGLILTLAILGIYYQTLNFEFVLLDDDVYVTANPHVTGGLSFASIKWAFTKSHGGFWIPLTWISYMFDCQLHGLNAGDYHMTNLIFHVLNTLLLFVLIRQMTGDIWRSSFVAALFAVHPVHVESVAWVAERKDLLFAFFWLLTMWSYQYYVKQPCIRRYLPILLFFSAGLMSKPMIVTLPFVLMLIDFWPLRRLQLKKSGPSDAGSPGMLLIYLVLEKAPLLILSLCASVLTFILQQSHGALSSLKTSPITDRVANGLVSYVKYLAKMIWPHDLAVMYPYPHSIPLWQIAGSFLLLGLITFLVIKQFSDHPYLIVGWLWYLGTLVPVIGIIKVGAHAMADRYTYFTFIGLYIMIAWGIPEFLGKWKYEKVVLVSAVTVIFSILVISARTQAACWANSIRLFNHVIAVTGDNFLAHKNLGLALVYRGQLDKAAHHFKEALRINPDSADCYNDIGTYLMLTGRYDDSAGYFEKALHLEPNFAKAHNNMGLVLMSQGNFIEAAAHFRAALQADPDFRKARYNLEKALASLKDSSL